MDYLREDHAIVIRDEDNKKIAEITYVDTEDSNVIAANHTYTADELRGQGIAGKLLDELVHDMLTEGKKIQPICPYVVRKFDEEPEKYAFIDSRQ